MRAMRLEPRCAAAQKHCLLTSPSGQQVGAAIKALSKQIKLAGANVGIGVATMLGFEDTVKLFKARSGRVN